MAAVTLEQAWFHDGEAFATFVAANLSTASEQAGRAGEVRRYAGGRLRVVTGPARPGEISIELLQCDRTVVDQLRGWLGTRLLYRDPRGRSEFGTFLQLTVTEVPGVAADFADVALTFQKVSGSVAV